MRTALRYAGEVAETLRALHDEGRFHGDVDPTAVRITTAGALLAPPNGHSHLATAQTDISAFGSLLYRMLTGATPNSALPVLVSVGDRQSIRLRATRLAARCLGAVPDTPADIQKVATEVRLLSVLARQRSEETEPEPASPPAAEIETPAPVEIEETVVATAPVASEMVEPLVTAAPEPHIHHDHEAQAASPEETCPRCGGSLGTNSRPRSAFEALLRTFGFPVRRCSRCFHRYVIFLGLPIHKAAHV